MATNPRIPSVPPEERKQPQLVVPNTDRLHPDPPGSAVPGVIIAVLVAAILLGVILYFLPRTPKQAPTPAAAEVPVQPVPGELQLGAMQLIAGPTGGFYLDGRITNAGPHDVTGIVAEIKVRGRENEVIEDIRRPVEGMTVKAHDLVADSFATDPIKPNQTRPFRINVDQVPNSWNNNLPEVQIVDVTATGTGK